MKKTLFTAVLVATAIAHAQSSTVAAPAAQTSTASTSVAAPASAKKWSAQIYSGMSQSVQDANELKGDAPISSTNYLAFGYKLSDKIKVEARHNFTYASKTGVGAEAKTKSNYNSMSPAVMMRYSSQNTLLGSKPLAYRAWYYIPVDETSQNVKSAGVVRLDTMPAWDATAKLEVAFLARAQATMFQRDSDGILRLITGPTLTYAVNDSVAPYYSLYNDSRSSSVNRGEFAFNVRNELYHEVGVGFTAGAFNITPSVSSYNDYSLNDQTNGTRGEGFFTPENTSYGLELVGTF